MKKLYINCIFILILFLSSIAFSEVNEEIAVDQSNNSPSLPLFLQESNFSSVIFNSVFYNQSMEKRSLENFDNRFIIIHFWSTWCMECQNELIMLNKLQKEFRKKALTVIALSEDFKAASAIDEYFTKHKIDFLDIYIDKKSSIYKELNVNHLPVSYLVDLNGNVIAHSTPGVPVDWDDEDLKKFLESKVSQHQLLPPEFKNARDKYIPPVEITKETTKEVTKEDKKKESKEKSEIFIN